MAITRILVDTLQRDATTPLDELDISLTDWSILCWAGLQHEAPMSYDAFCARVPMGQIVGGIAAIVTAWVQGMFPTTERPPAGQEVAAQQAPLATGTGADIGPEPALNSSSLTTSSGA
jgi:hypothetical protein